VVKIILQIINVIQSLKIDDLLAQHWEAFREARDKFRKWVADLSEAIGWGADGFLHLLHASQGFTDVVGGIFGKSWAWMDTQFMEKTGSVLEKTSSYAEKLRDNPGDILEIIFQGEMKDSFNQTWYFGDKLFRSVDEGLTKAKTALSGLSGVASELSKIKENIPDVVRKNIPVEIWESLDKFSETVDRQILPRIYTAERKIDFLNSMFSVGNTKLTSLADRLAHPGTNLLSIDDLPDYARESEQWALDEVTSRAFGQAADADRLSMQADLDQFDLIDAAAASPPVGLPFMDLEAPQRATLLGVMAEPAETWFIDGFGDKH